MTASIEDRLARVEATLAIQQTLANYCLALDSGNAGLFAECFTENCVVDYLGHVTAANIEAIRARGGMVEADSERYAGRAQMHALAMAHSRPPDSYHKHMTSLPVVQIDGDSATATSYLALLLKHEGRPVLAAFARYDDIVVRETDGCWRIQRRMAHLEAHAGTPPLVRRA